MEAVNRTFVGIRIPDDVAGQIQQQAQTFRRRPGAEHVRWAAPTEYLIQLASLGELSPMTLSRLSQILPEALSQQAAFRIDVVGFGGAPNAVQPRSIHAELGGDLDRLEALAQAIDREVAPLLPNRDVQGYRPRIALGRLKTESEQIRVALGRTLKMTKVPAMGSIAVHTAELLISQSSEFGIGFRTIANLPLANL